MDDVDAALTRQLEIDQERLLRLRAASAKFRILLNDEVAFQDAQCSYQDTLEYALSQLVLEEDHTKAINKALAWGSAKKYVPDHLEAPAPVSSTLSGAATGVTASGASTDPLVSVGGAPTGAAPTGAAPTGAAPTV
jgi:hypothetical protein